METLRICNEKETNFLQNKLKNSDSQEYQPETIESLGTNILGSTGLETSKQTANNTNLPRSLQTYTFLYGICTKPS